jgi:ribonuclease HI
LTKADDDVIDRPGAWAYFHGVAQDDPQVCGAGGLIYLKDSHVLKFKAGLGRGTNNFSEIISTLIFSLMLASDKGASKIQILGDSQIVIK